MLLYKLRYYSINLGLYSKTYLREVLKGVDLVGWLDFEIFVKSFLNIYYTMVTYFSILFRSWNELTRPALLVCLRILLHFLLNHLYLPRKSIIDFRSSRSSRCSSRSSREWRIQYTNQGRLASRHSYPSVRVFKPLRRKLIVWSRWSSENETIKIWIAETSE